MKWIFQKHVCESARELQNFSLGPLPIFLFPIPMGPDGTPSVPP